MMKSVQLTGLLVYDGATGYSLSLLVLAAAALVHMSGTTMTVRVARHILHQ